MKVTIKKIGINGEGIGYIDRLPVFVPGALIDEEVDIQVIEKNKRYAKGKVNRILKKSKDRVKPKCFVQDRCGGCPLMDVKYPKQLEYKYELLKQSLIKYAQVNPRLIQKVIPSEDVFEYRNQFKMPCAIEEGVLASGMFLPNSNYFFGINRCVVHNEGLEHFRKDVMRVLNEYEMPAYDYHKKSGIRNLIARGFDGKYQCTIVTGDDELSQEAIDALMKIKGMYSLWQSIHTTKKTPEVFGNQMIFLAGERYLPLTFDGLKLELSPRSFFQLNTKQAMQLYRGIAAQIKDGNDLIVEAYSGVGAISLYLKDKAKEIIGIESIKDAVVNANKNAKANGCEHVSFVCADAADKLTYISKKRSIDVLVVDPPRSGLDDAMLECILRSKIKNIVYVSCNPATLGKNLAALQSRYIVKNIQPYDMFPHTPLVEAVCLLSKLNTKQHIEVEVKMDELDLTSAESKATYEEIKEYVLEHSGLKVSSLYIAQVKQKCGIIERENYNKPKSEDARQPQCPPDKEKAITEALKHFGMI